MSYYGAGDYYRGRGDYYRGDPFSIGGILKGVGKVAGGFVGGLIKGGPIGAIAGGIGAIAGGAGSGGSGGTPILPPPPPIPVFSAGTGIMSLRSPTEVEVLSSDPRAVKKPGMRGAIERILPGGGTGYILKKSRRMNVTNPRALRRAIRRVSGFGKLVQRSKKAIGRANTAVGNRRRKS
jgi:hypothetical protein